MRKYEWNIVRDIVLSMLILAAATLGRLEIFIVVIGFTFGFGMLKDTLRGRKRG